MELQKIDNSIKIVLRAVGKIDKGRLRPETRFNLLQDTFRIGTQAIKLIDKSQTRDLIAVCLSPYGLTLRLDTFDSGKNNHRAVEDAKTAFHLRCKVDMARSIDQIDLMVVPRESGCGRRNGNASFAFIQSKIHDGLPIMHFPDLMGAA
jgi:hypothetical protein